LSSKELLTKQNVFVCLRNTFEFVIQEMAQEKTSDWKTKNKTARMIKTDYQKDKILENYYKYNIKVPKDSLEYLKRSRIV